MKEAHQFDRLPSTQNKDGSEKTPVQARRAVEHLFKKNVYQPRFAVMHHLLHFFRPVGKGNVSFLRKIKVEGALSKLLGYCAFRDALEMRLAIYTFLPKEVCANLQKLILHRSQYGNI